MDDDRKAGFLMGLTGGYLALVEVLVRKGVLDKYELAKELEEMIPLFSADYEGSEDWIRATITNIVRDEDEQD